MRSSVTEYNRNTLPVIPAVLATLCLSLLLMLVLSVSDMSSIQRDTTQANLQAMEPIWPRLSSNLLQIIASPDNLSDITSESSAPLTASESIEATAVPATNTSTNHVPTNIPENTNEARIIKYFDPGIDSLALSSNDLSSLQELYLEYVDVKNNVSIRQLITLDEEMPNSRGIHYSQLYTFRVKVKEVRFYYSGEKHFEVHTYDDDSEAITINKTDSAPTYYGDSPAEDLYTNTLFAQMDLNIITRAEWQVQHTKPDGSAMPEIWPPPYAGTYRIVVHHTATEVNADPAVTVRAIHYNHAVTQDWTDIGYHYLIDPQGNIYEGRKGGNGVRGNHAIPNTGTIGIALLGNFSASEPTPAALDALTRLIAKLSHLNNLVPTYGTTVVEHNLHLYQNGTGSTACAGANLINKLEQVSANARNLMQLNSRVKTAEQKYLDFLEDEPELAGATEGQAQISLDTTTLSDLLEERVITQDERALVRIFPNSVLNLTFTQDLLLQFLIELELVIPEAKISVNAVNYNPVISE